MKVLWLGHNLAFPPKGGALQRNYNLLREIARSCEVHMLAFDQPVTRPDNVAPSDCVRELAKFCASVDWVPLTTASRYSLALRGIFSGEPYDFAWLRSPEMQRKLDDVLARVNPDVIHVDALGLAQFAPRPEARPTLLNHHDVESCKIAVRAQKTSSLPLRTYFAMEAKKLAAAEYRWCPRFGVNAVVSEAEGDVLRAVNPAVRVAVVPNGVDTEFFRPRKDPGGQKIVFCGSMDMHPNQEAVHYFIEKLWPSISAKVPTATFDIVGRKPPQWVEALAQTDSRVRVTGFVEDVRPYFEEATVCVSPIVSGGGTRLKILDSLAMGVPVVSTPFAASGLDLQHGRHVLLPDTDAQFIEDTVRLLNAPTERAVLAQHGAQRVDELYSWRVVGKTLLQAYETARQFTAARVA
ncbi:MAG: glycosyltransferase family 4 protein [Nitrospiraceae bacterium]